MLATANPANSMVVWNYLGKLACLETFSCPNSYRQTSLNDKSKRVDRLIWNDTENLIKGAEADVLEIFDWYSPL